MNGKQRIGRNESRAVQPQIRDLYLFTVCRAIVIVHARERIYTEK